MDFEDKKDGGGGLEVHHDKPPDFPCELMAGSRCSEFAAQQLGVYPIW